MASGMVDTGAHQDWLEGWGSAPDPFASDGYDMHDAVELSVSLIAPEGASGFALDFIFMSAEYEEWIGTSFNDKFYVILNAPDSTNGVDVVINAGLCSNPDAYYDFENAMGKWCYIAVNSFFSEPCTNPTTNISGTGYECGVEGSSTGWLTTRQPIQPGEAFELRLHIHDTSDQAYDSAAIIDNFRWLTGPVEAGTTLCATCGPQACWPDCENKVCGDDGCGGSCGECPGNDYCGQSGQCITASECEGDNPAGCATMGCPEGQICDLEPDDDGCYPTSCACAVGLGWLCTEDCDGGVCVDDPAISSGGSIRIELYWDTPADEDQTDEGPDAGADLDLHFTHPLATGDDGLGWFDQPFDCFWFNAAPNWGSLDPSVDDDPKMTLDDTDGAGPEIIEFPNPEDDATYRVGVHYWSDHDFGMSLATVKIWINDELAATIPEDGPGVALVDLDLWEVAAIDWPSGDVTVLETATGAPTIISDYTNPFFPPP
jgi:hypothetical protein